MRATDLTFKRFNSNCFLPIRDWKTWGTSRRAHFHPRTVCWSLPALSKRICGPFWARWREICNSNSQCRFTFLFIFLSLSRSQSGRVRYARQKRNSFLLLLWGIGTVWGRKGGRESLREFHLIPGWHEKSFKRIWFLVKFPQNSSSFVRPWRMVTDMGATHFKFLENKSN